MGQGSKVPCPGCGAQASAATAASRMLSFSNCFSSSINNSNCRTFSCLASEKSQQLLNHNIWNFAVYNNYCTCSSFSYNWQGTKTGSGVKVGGIVLLGGGVTTGMPTSPKTGWGEPDEDAPEGLAPASPSWAKMGKGRWERFSNSARSTYSCYIYIYMETPGKNHMNQNEWDRYGLPHSCWTNS